MRKIGFFSLLMATMVLFFSCKKNQATLENLSSVKFEEAETKTLSEVKTGNVVNDPATGENKFEYLITVQKPYTLAPLSLVSEMNSEVIYPGSILQGGSFMKGVYDPVRLANDFEPVDLSVTLRGDGLVVSKSVVPVLSKIRQATNDLIAGQENKISGKYVPAVFDYQSHTVSTEESMKRSFSIHVGAEVFKGIVKADFNYNQSKAHKENKHYVMISFRQFLYNIAIDPKHYSQWIKGDIDVKQMGGYEPVYISSVDYGRMAYIMIETNKSVDETKAMFEAAVRVSLKVVKAGVDVKYHQEFAKLFSESKVKVKIVGGPVELAAGVNDIESFTKFIQMPNAKQLIASSAPIAYKVRRLRDNTEVDVKDAYTECFVELRDK